MKYVWMLWLVMMFAVLNISPAAASQTDILSECRQVSEQHGLGKKESKEVMRALFRINMTERFGNQDGIDREYIRLYSACEPLLWRYGRQWR